MGLVTLQPYMVVCGLEQPPMPLAMGEFVGEGAVEAVVPFLTLFPTVGSSRGRCA